MVAARYTRATLTKEFYPFPFELRSTILVVLLHNNHEKLRLKSRNQTNFPNSFFRQLGILKQSLQPAVGFYSLPPFQPLLYSRFPSCYRFTDRQIDRFIHLFIHLFI
jgi:hypothetical protein